VLTVKQRECQTSKKKGAKKGVAIVKGDMYRRGINLSVWLIGERAKRQKSFGPVSQKKKMGREKGKGGFNLGA